jgi:predicted enzyme related to lactoylglutathione lyase
LSAIGKLGWFVLDVNDVDRAAAFWTRLLDVKVKHGLPGYTILEAQEGMSALALQEVPEFKNGKNRAHPNLTVDGIEQAERDIHELGGTTVSKSDTDGFVFYVMADPDGNEFCIATL